MVFIVEMYRQTRYKSCKISIWVEVKFFILSFSVFNYILCAEGVVIKS